MFLFLLQRALGTIFIYLYNYNIEDILIRKSTENNQNVEFKIQVATMLCTSDVEVDKATVMLKSIGLYTKSKVVFHIVRDTKLVEDSLLKNV